MAGKRVLVFEGCNYFRQRLLLSTLTGRPIKIINIREKGEDPGLKEFEASFLRLLDSMSNGTQIEVSETGTTLKYQPGLLLGGKIEHTFSLQRSLGWYLEPLMILAPFCKHPLKLTLRGITNDQIDPSVDVLKLGGLPILRRLLLDDEGLELKVVKRGLPPGGGGEVIFSCPICRTLRPLQVLDQGKIKRIRGVAYALRVSPTMANRMVETAKGVLLNYIPDVYLYTDHYKGAGAGKSPGFGMCLVAESTTGVFYTAEAVSNPSGSGQPPSVPEDIATQAAHLLLEEIYRGGIVDSSSQVLALAGMAFGRKDVSKALMGPLSPYSIEFLKSLRTFLEFIFKIDEKEDDEDLQTGSPKHILSCLGIGYSNLSKTVS